MLCLRIRVRTIRNVTLESISVITHDVSSPVTKMSIVRLDHLGFFPVRRIPICPFPFRPFLIPCRPFPFRPFLFCPFTVYPFRPFSSSPLSYFATFLFRHLTIFLLLPIWPLFHLVPFTFGPFPNSPLSCLAPSHFHPFPV